VERAIELAKEQGGRRSIRLPVSAPFHCRLLAPAADVMAEALAEVEVGKPRTPLVANVTAAAVTDPEEIRSLLVEQVTARVRWREVVVFMRAQEVDTQVELGAGKVLSGLARRIDRDLACIAVGAPEDVDAFVESL
jgi:[acyl-carrier-protein] S-malonyltransferase